MPAQARADPQDRHVMTVQSTNCLSVVSPGAGHRLATATTVLCDPLRRRSTVTPTAIGQADATRCPRRTRPATRHARLTAPSRTQAAGTSRPNPHSARGTGVPQDSRVPSLEAFGHRPRCLPHCRDGPASETLHNSGTRPRGMSQWTKNSAFSEAISRRVLGEERKLAAPGCRASSVYLHL